MRIRGFTVRRVMLGAGLALLAAPAWWPATANIASASGETRTLSLYEIHTKETLTVTYKRDGKFDEEGLKKLNHFMRDWRRDEETKMDPELIDLIWTLHKQLGSQQPIHLISGYRSAKTNASMRSKGGGQAKKSQHIQGKAADIHFPDVPIKTLRNSALVHEVGGVGYYPTSGIPFVHVDTGNVRMWPRIPRLELAALFPSGKTGYLPGDGKPITQADYRLAAAKGLVSKTMVASAVPLPTPKPGSLSEPDFVEPAIPQAIFASYTPGTSAGLSAASNPIQPAAKGFIYASASGPGFNFPRPRLLPKADAPPPYESADFVGAPEVDDDHPDELSYVPFETASLMTDSSVTYSHTIAPLVHPEQQDLKYLLGYMDQPLAFTLRPSSGYSSLAAAQQFSGAAVKSLYAEMERTGATTRLAQSTR
ncbi:MAG: DUF882 domain-containing protein [Methyloceanibacter sp.]